VAFVYHYQHSCFFIKTVLDKVDSLGEPSIILFNSVVGLSRFGDEWVGVMLVEWTVRWYIEGTRTLCCSTTAWTGDIGWWRKKRRFKILFSAIVHLQLRDLVTKSDSSDNKSRFAVRTLFWSLREVHWSSYWSILLSMSESDWFDEEDS